MIAHALIYSYKNSVMMLVCQSHSAIVYVTIIMHSCTFIHNTLAVEAKTEPWENLAYNSDTHNDPNEGPHNCT